MDMVNSLCFSIIVAFVTILLVPVAWADDDHALLDYQLRKPGRIYSEDLNFCNSCRGDHTVSVKVNKAPWLKLVAGSTVKIASDNEVTIPVNLDLRTIGAGFYIGNVEFRTVSCTQNCGQQPVQVPVMVDIPYQPVFGDSPADAKFGGLVNGQPVDIGVLLNNVLGRISSSAYGTSPQGKRVVALLKESYLENNLSDITIVPTVDTVSTRGRLGKSTPSVEREATRPGEATYVKQEKFGLKTTFGGPVIVETEQIFIGVDISLMGIHEARRNASDYFVFTHMGKMGVIGRWNLVNNLVHEGFHAVLAGKYNLKGRACIPEEIDAFAAGDAACWALGIPGKSQGVGPGYGALPNPAYTSFAPVPEILQPAPPDLQKVDPSLRFAGNELLAWQAKETMAASQENTVDVVARQVGEAHRQLAEVTAILAEYEAQGQRADQAMGAAQTQEERMKAAAMYPRSSHVVAYKARRIKCVATLVEREAELAQSLTRAVEARQKADTARREFDRSRASWYQNQIRMGAMTVDNLPPEFILASDGKVKARSQTPSQSDGCGVGNRVDTPLTIPSIRILRID